MVEERDALPVADPDSEPTEEELKLSNRITSNVNRSVLLAEKISRLGHPSEREARIAKKEKTHARITKLRRNNSMAKETAKDQGVPEVYLSESGNFKIGMDARLKSDLVNSALGLITTEEPGAALHVFTEKEATALLEKRGWMHFLDRKREIETAKAEKKAKAAEEREVREREKAEAKAKKDAEKQAAKEAAAAAKAESGGKADGGKGGSGGLSKTEQARQQREAKAAAAANA